MTEKELKRTVDELVIGAGVKVYLNGTGGTEYMCELGKDIEIGDYVMCGNKLYVALRGIAPRFTGEFILRYTNCYSRETGWIWEIETFDIKMPKGVRVGHFVYETKRGKSIKKHNKRKLGNCSVNNGTIFVADDLTPEKELEVWIHEITHAIVQSCRYELGLEELSHDGEEQFVRLFSRIAADTIRRNPQYFMPKPKQPYAPVEAEVITFKEENDIDCEFECSASQNLCQL